MSASTTTLTLQQGDMSETTFSILRELLSSGSDQTTPRSAAERAAATASDKQAIDDGYLFALWNDVFRAAEQVPSTDHPALDRLVLFVRELSLRGDLGIKVWEKRVWTDLPILGAALREKLNGPDLVPDEGEQAKINTAWVLFHAFEARLMAAGVLDLSTHALWMLREALEEEGIQAGSKEADRDILTAATWIEFAGPMLFEKVLWKPNPECGEEDKRLLRAGSLYKGGPGLSADRWLFWKNRFEEVAEKVATKDSESKAAAVRAARLMDVWAATRMALPK